MYAVSVMNKKKIKLRDDKDVLSAEETADGSVHDSGKTAKKKNGRLSKGKIIAITSLLVVYVLVVTLAAFVVFYVPSTSENKRTFTETVIDEKGNVIVKEVEETQLEGTYNILLLGHDRAAMLTDVFMLININNLNHSITIMQIPRDTWISDSIGSSVGIGIPTNKINATFSSFVNYHRACGEEYEDAYLHALTTMSEALEDALHIEINFSAIMDLDGFCNIVDILGGVEMDVLFNMDYEDPEQGLYIHIPAGHQTLMGNDAEGFVRYRYGYPTADLGRQNAQKQFMTALFDKVKSSLSLSNISMLTDLADEIWDNIETDMTAADVLYFAKSVLKCDLSGMNMMTMPGNLASSYYVMNRAAVLQVMNGSYNVFGRDISDMDFDQNQVFNCPGDGAISGAYYTSAEQMWDATVYNADEINDEYIDIPHY